MITKKMELDLKLSNLILEMTSILDNSREKSLVITKLEEAQLWLTKTKTIEKE